MGKCVDKGYIPYTEITVCNGCFHKEVCGDKDYLIENTCSSRVGGCYCKDCKHYGREEHHVSGGECAWWEGLVNPDDYCSYGKLKDGEDDE